MQPKIGSLLVPREAMLAFVMWIGHVSLVWSAGDAIVSGVYQTLPGATVEERGDRLLTGERIVPISATVTLDVGGGQPSLTAELPNAVLEGGDPFALTVRSTSGVQLMDGTYRFMGDYLQDIYPSGTQYGFDWRFSASTNGQLVWNGIIGWMGGHYWQVTISNLTLVPAAQLSIAQAGPSLVQIAWAGNATNHVLEYATALPAVAWSVVTNAVIASGDRLFVTVSTEMSPRFYRLRKP